MDYPSLRIIFSLSDGEQGKCINPTKGESSPPAAELCITIHWDQCEKLLTQIQTNYCSEIRHAFYHA